MSGIDWIAESRSIFELVTSRYVAADGMLVARGDAESGAVVDPEMLTSDFGDYIQNFYALGQAAGDPRILDWCLSHLAAGARAHQHRSGFFRTSRGARAVSIRDNGDTLVGLSATYCLSRDASLLRVIERFVDGIERHVDGDGFVPRSLWGGVGAPVAHAAYSGNFIEELALLAGELGRPEWAALADRLLEAWIRTEHFQSHGLFPNGTLRGGLLGRMAQKAALAAGFGRLARSSLVKANTNMVSGILALLRLPEALRPRGRRYKDVLDRWSESVERHCGADGYYYGIYDFQRGRRSEYRRPMPDNNHVLAAYADAFALTGDGRYRERLLKGCDFWLERQRETGFFPEAPLQRGENAERALMDSNLDLAVVLMKAAELAEQPRYLEAARRCLTAIVTHMKRPRGYVESVVARTGASSGNNRIYIKYITLLIKGFLILDASLKGRKPSERGLFLIARDR